MGVKGMKVRAIDPKNWVGLMPYGVGKQHPNSYKDIVDTLWENKDSLGYAWRILHNGCCDGCALGTTGLHDWTLDGIHLCAVRLDLLRLNTMGGMDESVLEDAHALQGKKEKELRALGRLTHPMVRRRGEKGFQKISWDEAMEVAAGHVRGTDPHRIGWYLTSRGLTNEAYYAHQKVARFLGTNNIDTSARICHAPSTAALGATVGVAATTCSYKDWIGTDLLVFVGSNVANNQPVATKYLYYAKKAGTKVFVVNPYREPGMERYWVPSATESALFGTKIADDFFQIHTGGDVPFFYGVLKHLIENDWLNHAFIRERTVGWEETEKKVHSLTWEELEAASGQTKEEMYRFAQAFGTARSAIIVWSMGITQHRFGSDNVRAIVNLQLARGNVGRPQTGLMPIRGHSGVQGGAEMGAQPGAYVMGHPIAEDEAKTFAQEDYWGFQPPVWKGLGAAQLILAAEAGEIDILWQSGGNFMDTLPEPGRVHRALGEVSLRIHQDIVFNPTMLVEPKDTVLILPSRTRYEQKGGGTETSTERRIILSPEISGPRLAGSRDEWEIPVLLARAVNPEGAAKAFPWKDTADIRQEIDRVCPTYKGIGKLQKKGDHFQYGGPMLLVDRFPTPDGKGHFSATDLPGEEIPEGHFILSTRRGKQFNSLVHKQKDALNGARREDILMSLEDAASLGLHMGDPILVTSEVGVFQGKVRIDRIKPGSLQGHWPEVNVLIPAGRLDPSGVPDYNALVTVKPLREKEEQMIGAAAKGD